MGNVRVFLKGRGEGKAPTYPDQTPYPARPEQEREQLRGYCRRAAVASVRDRSMSRRLAATLPICTEEYLCTMFRFTDK